MLEQVLDSCSSSPIWLVFFAPQRAKNEHLLEQKLNSARASARFLLHVTYTGTRSIGQKHCCHSLLYRLLLILRAFFSHLDVPGTCCHIVIPPPFLKCICSGVETRTQKKRRSHAVEPAVCDFLNRSEPSFGHILVILP